MSHYGFTIMCNAVYGKNYADMFGQVGIRIITIVITQFRD